MQRFELIQASCALQITAIDGVAQRDHPFVALHIGKRLKFPAATRGKKLKHKTGQLQEGFDTLHLSAHAHGNPWTDQTVETPVS